MNLVSAWEDQSQVLVMFLHTSIRVIERVLTSEATCHYTYSHTKSFEVDIYAFVLPTTLTELVPHEYASLEVAQHLFTHDVKQEQMGIRSWRCGRGFLCCPLIMP